MRKIVCRLRLSEVSRQYSFTLLFHEYAKKPDKDRHLSLRLIRLPFL